MMRRRPLRPSLRPLRRRKPLRQGKPLKARSQLRRHTRLRPVNPERRAALYPEQFGTHAERIRSLPCILADAPPPSDPHHVVTRAARGRWWHLVPLCRPCHIQWHARGERSLPRGWSRERLLGEALRLAWESFELGIADEPPGEPRQEKA